MGLFNTIDFVRDEIKTIPNIGKHQPGGVGKFASRIGYALILGFKEKEIFLFGLLQWLVIGLGYLLWAQMLDWIPEEVWRRADKSNNGSIVDWVLLIWSFVCVGVVAYPLGILTGCMGAAHFLNKLGHESTIDKCFALVLPQGWTLWSFHWLDGWITVYQILLRLPKKNDHSTWRDRGTREALYYAWKLGIAGVLPSILTGNNLIQSGKNSVVFVKDKFTEVAKLRGGYSMLCWVVGIGAYIGTIVFFRTTEIISKHHEIYGQVYTFYMWAAIPLLVAVAIIMLVLRPVYILSLCDLYSEYLFEKGEDIILPDNPPRRVSALIAYGFVCLLLAGVYGYRYELGIMNMLSTPYGQMDVRNQDASNLSTAKSIQYQSQELDALWLELMEMGISDAVVESEQRWIEKRDDQCQIDSSQDVNQCLRDANQAHVKVLTEHLIRHLLMASNMGVRKVTHTPEKITFRPFTDFPDKNQTSSPVVQARSTPKLDMSPTRKAPQRGAIYKCTNEAGKLEITDKPCATGEQVVLTMNTSQPGLNPAAPAVPVQLPEGDEGIHFAIREGLIRAANDSDIKRWEYSSRKKFKRTRAHNVYVILKPITLTGGLAGAHSVTFIVNDRRLMPSGNLGHSSVLFTENGGCTGVLCLTQVQG